MILGVRVNLYVTLFRHSALRVQDPAAVHDRAEFDRRQCGEEDEYQRYRSGDHDILEQRRARARDVATRFATDLSSVRSMNH